MYHRLVGNYQWIIFKKVKFCMVHISGSRNIGITVLLNIAEVKKIIDTTEIYSGKMQKKDMASSKIAIKLLLVLKSNRFLAPA